MIAIGLSIQPSVVSGALADDTTVGFVIGSLRQSSDPAIPQSSYVEANFSHDFGRDWLLGGSAHYSDTAFSSDSDLNLEGTIGHRFRVSDVFSLLASAGIGERFLFQEDDTSFPYYVFRVGADAKLSDSLTWNIATFRYRDAFDSGEDYLTPQIASGISVKLDAHNSVSTKAAYNWKDWDPDSVEFSLGLQHGF